MGLGLQGSGLKMQGSSAPNIRKIGAPGIHSFTVGFHLASKWRKASDPELQGKKCAFSRASKILIYDPEKT